MAPLPDALRRLCFGLACASLVVGIATLPLCVRSAADVSQTPRPQPDVARVTAASGAVPIRRNPFEADAREGSAAGSTPVPQATRSGYVVPIAGAFPTVAAIAIGAHPSAVLEQNGTSEIRTIGDRVATRAIVAISLAGVRLDDGTLLTLNTGAQKPVADGKSDPFPAIPLGSQPLPDVRGDDR